MSNYTSKEAAQILDCTTRYVTELCAQGKFPGAKQNTSGRWVIPQEAVLAVLAEKEISTEILPNDDNELVAIERRRRDFLRNFLDAEVFAEVLRNSEEYRNLQNSLMVVVEKFAEMELRNTEELQKLRKELAEAKKELTEAKKKLVKVEARNTEEQQNNTEEMRKLQKEVRQVQEWVRIEIEKKKKPWWARIFRK